MGMENGKGLEDLCHLCLTCRLNFIFLKMPGVYY
jgi:hypothetical protein